MNPRIALLLLVAASTTAQAEIFQWKDENGRVHFGEAVPAKYQKAAKQFEPGKLNTMPAQKSSGSPVSPSFPDAGNREAADTPAPASTDHCQTARQRYQESQECFARFRLANGAVRTEAYEECKDVALPPECISNR